MWCRGAVVALAAVLAASVVARAAPASGFAHTNRQAPTTSACLCWAPTGCRTRRYGCAQRDLRALSAVRIAGTRGVGALSSQFMLQARLTRTRSRRELADPHHAMRPIHAIAARWGFTNPAHFSQTFRSAYGLSPRQVRLQCTRAERATNAS
jgi:AraC-like DNA-binding protein